MSKESLEEGDPCNQPGCPGVIEVEAVENCSCHISPPCGACVNAGLVCNVCGYEVSECTRPLSVLQNTTNLKGEQ